MRRKKIKPESPTPSDDTNHSTIKELVGVLIKRRTIIQEKKSDPP
ncbi:8536_t:CDS:1, partial [Gigaspora rosea]